MWTDATQLFNKLREKAETQSKRESGFFSNQNLLKLKQGYTYKLRLLWLPPADGYDREYPMINQYVHRFWDNNAIGSKNIEVYCKTSQYDEGESAEGFKCPICRAMSDAYKEYANNGSSSAKEIYDTFRRSFRGYIPVYVVSGPAEDNHKIKILQYTKTFKDYFDLKIFGFSKNKNEDGTDNNISEDEILGVDVFTYYDSKSNSIKTKAFDLNVNVSSKSVVINGRKVTVPVYSLEFGRKMTDIEFEDYDMDVDRFCKLSSELNFDKDFLKKSSTEELTAFLNKYVKFEHEVTTEDIEEVERSMKSSSKVEKSSKPELKSSSILKTRDNADKDGVEDVLDDTDNDESEDITNNEDSSNDEDNDGDIDIDDLLKDL